jgi:hypothetical protein
MADTYYLWSPVNTEVNEWGRVTKTAKVGDEATAKSLNVSQDEFEELVKVGVVRTEPYPDIPADMAPLEHFRAMGAGGGEEDLSNAERKELQAFREAEANRLREARGQADPTKGQGKPAENK